ncbi:MAG: flavodoxin [Methanomassiliicoccales archaeon PtaB.Bin134]|nr:MAG: flavodoxin [Methanomassiliicoccales archaeon PtaB.Bin134]
MRCVVAYDSVHGSTRAVAEAMVEQATSEGHEAQLLFVRDDSDGLAAADLLLIGSPTRGGVMTKQAKAFVDGLDPGVWKGRRVATFDTLGPISRDPERRSKVLRGLDDRSINAANRMRELLLERGIPVERTMHFPVLGLWGPIAPEGVRMARGEMHQLLMGGPAP